MAVCLISNGNYCTIHESQNTFAIFLHCTSILHGKDFTGLYMREIILTLCK